MHFPAALPACNAISHQFDKPWTNICSYKLVKKKKKRNNITSRSSGAATIVIWMFVCIYSSHLKRFFHSFSAIHEWTRKRESSIIYTHFILYMQNSNKNSRLKKKSIRYVLKRRKERCQVLVRDECLWI